MASSKDFGLDFCFFPRQDCLCIGAFLTSLALHLTMPASLPCRKILTTVTTYNSTFGHFGSFFQGNGCKIAVEKREQSAIWEVLSETNKRKKDVKIYQTSSRMV
jgi:hypothetical protein